MPTVEPSNDPSQRDISWVGYHPRASTPTFALAAIATAVVLAGRWYIEDLSEIADRMGALVVFALAWAVWPGLLAAFLYRTVTYTYRLTDRALLVDFGFLSKPTAPIGLTEEFSTIVGGGWLARWLGVGWVEVRTEQRYLRMPGVRNPAIFAAKIKAACAVLRGG